jgi:hypothetical protein
VELGLLECLLDVQFNHYLRAVVIYPYQKYAVASSSKDSVRYYSLLFQGVMQGPIKCLEDSYGTGRESHHPHERISKDLQILLPGMSQSIAPSEYCAITCVRENPGV